MHDMGHEPHCSGVTICSGKSALSLRLSVVPLLLLGRQQAIAASPLLCITPVGTGCGHGCGLALRQQASGRLRPAIEQAGAASDRGRITGKWRQAAQPVVCVTRHVGVCTADAVARWCAQFPHTCTSGASFASSSQPRCSFCTIYYANCDSERIGVKVWY
jgi:hypothetical protein